MSPDKPPNLPRRPLTIPNSAKAPPIPERPLAISPQTKEPIFFKLAEISSRDFTASTIDPEPRRPDIPANLPSTPLTTLTSAKAPPIPVSPFPIWSQSIDPIRLRFSEISSSESTAITRDAAPAIPEIPDNLPSTPVTTPSSVRAPPMAVRPLAISPQDISPSRLRFSDISSRDFEAISTAMPPRIALPPPTLLRIERTPVNSARAPPIAVRPLAISFQDIPPNLTSDPASISQALARAIIEILVLSVIFPFLLIIDIAFDKANIEVPMVTRPFAISFQDKPSSLTIAEAKISTALATAIIAIAPLIAPLA